MKLGGQESWDQMCLSVVGVKGESATYIPDTCCRCSGALPRFLFWTKALVPQLQGTCPPWELPCPPQGLCASIDCWWGVTKAQHSHLNWAQLHPKGHPNSRGTDRNCWGLCCHYITVQFLPVPNPASLPSWEHSQPTPCVLISDSKFPKELNQRHYPWPSSLLNKK